MTFLFGSDKVESFVKSVRRISDSEKGDNWLLTPGLQEMVSPSPASLFTTADEFQPSELDNNRPIVFVVFLWGFLTILETDFIDDTEMGIPHNP
ncbi:hypothetical protein J6590_042212 [Homalodisca vitripennis]|nr:hypothetical protein J6590_042212 [Homalodisca vitripennis]